MRAQLHPECCSICILSSYTSRVRSATQLERPWWMRSRSCSLDSSLSRSSLCLTRNLLAAIRFRSYTIFTWSLDCWAERAPLPVAFLLRRAIECFTFFSVCGLMFPSPNKVCLAFLRVGISSESRFRFRFGFFGDKGGCQ